MTKIDNTRTEMGNTKGNIAIVGGGIGGLALANTLQKLGIEYQLFERASEFSEVGAGIGLSESTLEILDTLDLKDHVLKQGYTIKRATIVDQNLTEIREIPVANEGLCIHRRSLINSLSKNLNSSNLNLNHELVDFVDDGEKVELIFSNGNTYDFDIVVACDGIHSLLRKKTFPGIKKRYSGQTIWRGIASCKLHEEFDNTYYEFWGNNLRFAIIPSGNNQYFWYAVKCSEPGKVLDSDSSKSELKELFKDYIPEVTQVIESSPKVIKDDMWDIEPDKRTWHSKNIVFIGDSIHATTPNLAQGGCQAIEDAATLGKTLDKYGNTEKAFLVYEELRQDKALYIVKQSWKFGQMSHQSNKFSEGVTKFFFKSLLPGSFFRKQYDRLIDIEYLKNI